MKRFYVILTVVMMAVLGNIQQVQAQSPEFKKFMESYTGADGITIMDITSSMLRLAGFGGNDKEAKELLSQLNRIVVITNENGFAGLSVE
ncbi:MAG: DUF4252 domain-containing protein, partial [Tidjanibacter sp.]|nr:DUF4252 domain-containing protein [Tidjanibacter sp.]